MMGVTQTSGVTLAAATSSLECIRRPMKLLKKVGTWSGKPKQETPLIRTPLLSNNSVLIREVSFGERENYMDSQY